MLQAFLASEPVVTSSYKWLSQCIMDKSDSLGNELGPLKGVTGIALPITQNRTESPEGPKRDLTKLTEKRSNSESCRTRTPLE